MKPFFILIITSVPFTSCKKHETAKHSSTQLISAQPRELNAAGLAQRFMQPAPGSLLIIKQNRKVQQLRIQEPATSLLKYWYLPEHN